MAAEDTTLRTVASVLALMLGGLALYARLTVLDPHAFADRATGTLQQDEVLALLLVWMPEVALDLALVSAAELLIFSAAAEVVRVARRSLIR
jgi:hypothetical protein